MASIISITLANLTFFKKSSHRYLSLLKDTICDNQGKLAEYVYSASEKHKKIKNELITKKNLIDTSKYNVSDLKKYCQELDEYVNLELKNIYTENFKYLLKYFEGRSRISPRVCFKGYNNRKIVALFRDRTLIPNREYPVSANTAFEYIYKTGNYYICNDIPTEFKERKYKNARINEQNALRYKSKGWIRRKFSKYSNSPDRKWINCWETPKIGGGGKHSGSI